MLPIPSPLVCLKEAEQISHKAIPLGLTKPRSCARLSRR